MDFKKTNRLLESIKGHLVEEKVSADGATPHSMAVLKAVDAHLRKGGWKGPKFTKEQASGEWTWTNGDKTISVGGWHGKNPKQWGAGMFLFSVFVEREKYKMEKAYDGEMPRTQMDGVEKSEFDKWLHTTLPAVQKAAIAAADSMKAESAPAGRRTMEASLNPPEQQWKYVQDDVHALHNQIARIEAEAKRKNAVGLGQAVAGMVNFLGGMLKTLEDDKASVEHGQRIQKSSGY